MIARRARKNGSRVSVLMFDLDHFKSINDSFGHAVGDAALRVFAETIQTTMRESDVIGRLGGEEFAAIVLGSANDAAIAAERVRAAFEAAGAVIAGHPIGATVSIGAADCLANDLQHRAAAVARRCGALCGQAGGAQLRPLCPGGSAACGTACSSRFRARQHRLCCLAHSRQVSRRSGPDLPAAAPGNRQQRRTRRHIGLEVRPAGRRIVEGRWRPNDFQSSPLAPGC